MKTTTPFSEANFSEEPFLYEGMPGQWDEVHSNTYWMKPEVALAKYPALVEAGDLVEWDEDEEESFLFGAHPEDLEWMREELPFRRAHYFFQIYWLWCQGPIDPESSFSTPIEPEEVIRWAGIDPSDLIREIPNSTVCANGLNIREEIVEALSRRLELGRQIAQGLADTSNFDYRKKLLAMTDNQLAEEAVGQNSSLEMRGFLKRWGQDSTVKYEINHLRKAVISCYAFICHKEGGTQPDGTSLKQYKKNIEAMSWDELIAESDINAADHFNSDALVDYMELWLGKSIYAEIAYALTEEGGTELTKLAGQELLDKVNELGDIKRSDVLLACGYVTTKDDGQEAYQFKEFYEALYEAKGLSLP